MKLEIHYADEWAALYRDGNLVSGTVGDSYHAEEAALELLGVEQVYDDSFMRGQDRREGVAQTLAAVEEYRVAHATREAEAQRLRDAAAELITRAQALEADTSV